MQINNQSAKSAEEVDST